MRERGKNMLTRKCEVCAEDRICPEEFRDAGESLRGRPSRTCRYCRAANPALAEAYALNENRKAGRRAYQGRLAERPLNVIAAVRRDMHPDGLKTCPPFSGCGERLPFAAFGFSRYQRDGLATRCADCTANARYVR